MNQINPYLLSKIFKHVPCIKQLAECRLVAKSWNDPAAEEMFSKKIRVRSEWTALRLYRHISIDKTKAKYIQHMHFELNEPGLSYVYDQLLRLVITPSIKKLTGSVKSEDFFTTLFEIIETLPKFDSLTEIPTYTGEGRDLTLEELLAMKRSVGSLRIHLDRNIDPTIWKLVQQMHQYKYLTFLIISGFVRYGSIEIILNSSPQLKTIQFSEPEFEYYEKADECNLANIQVQRSVETVIIKTNISTGLVNYVVRKYPNIKEIELQGKMWSWDLDFVHFGRVLDTIKHIKNKKITISLPPYTFYTKAIKFQQSRTENIQYHTQFVGNREILVLNYHDF